MDDTPTDRPGDKTTSPSGDGAAPRLRDGTTGHASSALSGRPRDQSIGGLYDEPADRPADETTSSLRDGATDSPRDGTEGHVRYGQTGGPPDQPAGRARGDIVGRLRADINGRLRNGPRLKQGAGAALPPFLAMEVGARANALDVARRPDDPRVIRLEVGQPATGAPATAIKAATRALQAGLPMGYTEAFGLPSLRRRIARHYVDSYSVQVPPERIAVSTGASGGFLLAFLAAFDPGDRIAMASPYYPPYANILQALGMQPVVLPTGPDTRFQPTVALIEALADTPEGLPDGLIVASPCNPAGTTLDAAELTALARFCDANGIRLISDEIYHGLNWDALPATACAFSDSAVVINSFSKYWSMTGWRVGWVVLPDDLRAPVSRLKQNLFISAPHISQIAAEAAFDATDEIALTLGTYRRNRAHLLDALPAAGLGDVAPAQGAFYLYARTPEDSTRFCDRLLRELRIAATPGIDFDPVRGDRFVRFSFCGPEADMIEAARRLRTLGGA